METMPLAELDNLLCFVQKLEDGWNSNPHMKDIIHRLELKIHILISEWKNEHEVSVLEILFQEDQQSEPSCVRLSGDGDARLSLTDLEKLMFIKPEVEEMYSIAFNSSTSYTFGNDKDLLSFVNLLHEDLKDILSSEAGILVPVKTQILALQEELRFLIVPVKTQILALQEELRFLRNFLCFISQFCIEHHFSQDLYTLAQAVAVNAAYLLHFLQMDQALEEDMKNGIKGELLYLVDKLTPIQQPHLGEIYLQALEGISRELSHLAVIDYECILRFFDSLVDSLRELLEKANLESVSKDQIEILHQELSSLRFYLMDFPLHDSDEKFDNFMFEIQLLTVQAGCFIYSCICKNQFTFLESYEGLLDKIEHVKSESNHLIIPRSWQLNFPKTNEVGYINFIIKNLEERLHCKSTPINGLMDQINTVYKELVAIRDDFGGFVKLLNDNEKLKIVFTRYRDVAYQAEYFVDSSLCGIVPFWCHKMGLFNLAEELRHIKKELKAILNDIADRNIGLSSTVVSLKANAQNTDNVLDPENEVQKRKDKDANQLLENEVQKRTEEDANQLVGFKDELEKIENHILGGSKHMTIISIIGMPGLGKTTLANSLFSDPLVTKHFNARARCSVSQVYNKDTLLLKILHQIQRETKEDHRKNEKCFDQKLYQSLKGKKYLIIMDDIWDIDAWNDFRPSFPDDGLGSRIIFTTRSKGVAEQVNSIPHDLRLLSDEESLKLLLVRVFKDETLCPSEILPAARNITKTCKCLPLTVVLTAGLLKTRERTKDSWEQFANVLTSHETLGQQHLGILELSYRHLPDYLKPCFLYFGAFPEDAEIPVWKLVQLWIAEGFVQPKIGQDAQEHEAGYYLSDLIDRSLVMIAKRSYHGGAKTCRIHDLLHDFCSNRAKEESFLLKINIQRNKHSPVSTLTDFEVHEQYRLSIHSNYNGEVPCIRMGHFESRVRSLWLFESSNDANSTGRDSSSTRSRIRDNGSPRTATRGMPSSRLFSPPSSSRFIYYNELLGIEVLSKFRLLRVLDFETLGIEDEDYATITQLVHLRYLSMSMPIQASSIPRGIGNLKNLETFLLNGDVGYVELPDTIWNMLNLRHIQVKPHGATFSSHEFFENCSKLDALTTLSTLVFRCGKELVKEFEKEVEKTMRKLPNLKKLKCIFLESWDGVRNANYFVVLDFLHQLEDLKISGFRNLHVLFPSSLKKLSLKLLSLSWDQISVIGELPNLEVLKLVNILFDGDEWCMKDEEFQKLKVLKLRSFGCARWYASSEHLPCLEKLVLLSCRYLEEIPLDFGEIPYLRMIKVNRCRTTLVDSARKIEEEQRGIGNDFNLYIGDVLYFNYGTGTSRIVD